MECRFLFDLPPHIPYNENDKDGKNASGTHVQILSEFQTHFYRIMRTINTVKMRLELRQDLYLRVTAERLHLRLS